MSFDPFKLFVQKSAWSGNIASFTICREHDLDSGQIPNHKAVAAIFPVGIWGEATQRTRAEAMLNALNAQLENSPPLKIG